MTTGMDSSTGGPKAEGTAIAFVNPSSVRFPQVRVGLALSSLLHLVQPALPAHHAHLLSRTQRACTARRTPQTRHRTARKESRVRVFVWCLRGVAAGHPKQSSASSSVALSSSLISTPRRSHSSRTCGRTWDGVSGGELGECGIHVRGVVAAWPQCAAAAAAQKAAAQDEGRGRRRERGHAPFWRTRPGRRRLRWRRVGSPPRGSVSPSSSQQSPPPSPQQTPPCPPRAGAQALPSRAAAGRSGGPVRTQGGRRRG